MMTPPAMRTVMVLERPLEPEERLHAFRDRLGDAGAIVSFTGVVRASQGTRSLILSHYPGYTEKTIREFVSVAQERFGLTAAGVWHRVGAMTPREPIVLVATASPHRRAAFEGADYIMDYLKSAAPFWKKEERADGAHWIEPTQQDIKDRQRWEVG